MIEVTEAGVKERRPTLRQRWNLFWRAMSLVFSTKRFHDVNMMVELDGIIQVSGWYKPPGEDGYKYHYICYDGKNQPSAFIDGKPLAAHNSTEPKRLGRTFTLEVLSSGKEDR